MIPLTVERGGRYLRVADPGWSDPLEGGYSRLHGGRWNAPGSFPVVYLNAGLPVARANVLRKYVGLPYGPEDLASDEGPVLVITEVAVGDYVNVVTDEGCRAVGLPESYPFENGEVVGWERCQPIGLAAWERAAPGIACRSAAPDLGRTGEELAWFQRDRSLKVLDVKTFDVWFWPR